MEEDVNDVADASANSLNVGVGSEQFRHKKKLVGPNPERELYTSLIAQIGSIKAASQPPIP